MSSSIPSHASKYLVSVNFFAACSLVRARHVQVFPRAAARLLAARQVAAFPAHARRSAAGDRLRVRQCDATGAAGARTVDVDERAAEWQWQWWQ